MTGPGTLTFWWQGSAPDIDGSQLTFAVGGTTLATVSDFTIWTRQTIWLGPGSQTLKWSYVQGPYSPGSYPGYIDQVTWTAGSTAPIILTPPFSQSVVPGLNATFSVVAGGTPPLTYQWQFNGVNISRATNSSYTVTNSQAANCGTYRVVLTNSAGTNTTPNASLEFGQVAAWGYSPSTDSRGTAPPGATNVLQLSTGWQHNLLLRTNGTVVDWGDTNLQAVPPATARAVNSAALNGAGVMLNADGTLSAWGNSGVTNIPPGLGGVIALAQGSSSSFCLALRSNGTVVAWGNNSSATNVPAGLTNVVSVAAGELHSLALKSDGTISAWGDNTYGQRNVPGAQLYSATTRVAAIAAGGFHSMALRSDGVVFAWGSNSSGQTNIPVLAKGGVVAIAAGLNHCLALRTNGTVVAWGQNAYGQTHVPSNLTNVVASAAGALHNLALVSDGRPDLAPLRADTFSSNVFTISLPSQSGRIFELDYKTSLTGTNWTVLPFAAGNGATLLLRDPSATDQQRFYRVRRW